MLKKGLKKTLRLLSQIGFEPVKLFNAVRGAPRYIQDYIHLKKQIKDNDFPLKWYPIFGDRYKQGGTASGHYFHQDLLVAQKIFRANPENHIDIGSRVDGFVAHVAAFRKLQIVDIRKMEDSVENIEFLQGNMMEVDSNLIESCDSLSCLHALEHFGLGRYGDPLDYEGHLRGFGNIHKILKVKGVFYFSVPIGTQRIEFNAHRVFSINYLLNMFEGKFNIASFSYVDDHGLLWKDVPLTDSLINSNCECDYGCGIFELVKY